jgi:hypothetical protein
MKNASHDVFPGTQGMSPCTDTEFKFACLQLRVAYSHSEPANYLENGARVSKRSISKPRNRLANPCVVEYLGPNFTEKGTMMDLSGDGMKIFGTRPVHVGMRLGH